MQVRTNIFISVLTLALMMSSPAYALKDAANLALDKLEKTTSAMETIEEGVAEAQKTVESAKSGAFGLDAIAGFDSVLEQIDIPKTLPKLEMPGDIAKNLNNADKTGDAVNKVMVPVYGNGKDSQVAYEQNRKRTEIQQNNISTLYAHALATRTNLAKERAIKAKKISQKDTRELLQAARGLNHKTAMRINDILFMEAQIVEFEGTQFLTTVRGKPGENDAGQTGGSK